MKSYENPSRTLANFAAGLQFDHIPTAVVARAEDLFLDWFGSTLAGKGARPVETIARFAMTMGPAHGPSEILISRRTSSPLFAAIVNAAASHFAEQDDVHNGSVFHPAAVIFPAVLAVGQSLGSSGRELLTASVAGYEAGIRIGEFMGRSHYTVFHTTGTVGTVAAAVAVGRLLQLTPVQMLDAMGSAGTQAAGLWEFLGDAADSKQLHTAKAAGDGLMAAYLARDGFKGATHILEGAKGMAAGMSQDADPIKLTDRLGQRWALAETSFKFHASCRHTHPAADALLQVIDQHHLAPQDISRVVTQVHQAAIDVLGAVNIPSTVHQGKFSMGTVLGLIAVFKRAGLNEFENSYLDPRVASVRDKVEMQLDHEVDGAYPVRWLGKVTVHTVDGRVLHGRVDEPKGDPGNTLSRPELETKAHELAAFSQAATPEEVDHVIQSIWNLTTLEKLEFFLPTQRQSTMATMNSIAAFMQEHDLVLATAESCTAGLIAATLAEVKGAGKLLDCAFVTYSPESKLHCLAVQPATLQQCNLTSEAVAREMAMGALQASPLANVSVSNTGVTDDTDPDVPAGTQCYAWAFRVGKDAAPTVFSATRRFWGDRNAIRQASALFALEQLPAYFREWSATR